jgi:ATP-dependent helicase HrpB
LRAEGARVRLTAVHAELPITALRASFMEALKRGPVVISSPTGSGKSTEVPRWCHGRVLVIEPRRVACRSLAARVAELEGSRMGDDVGYVVRDESMMNDATRIVFATPGIALRRPSLVESAQTVILDELHERGMDVDLLLALLLRRHASRRGEARGQGLVVMSATIEGERVARHVEGTYLAAEGRAFPVDVRYVEMGNVLPDAADLASRVVRAVDRAKSDAGDVLVFLPGKAEIEACRRALETSTNGLEIAPLHGGLTLDEQRLAFDGARRRKVILATNVAETSITIPGVGVVIDAGLVKQTRYRDGRASLTLAPIAEDSAAQRAGRAGRTAPGVCYRLWSPSATLAKTTLPEVHRESLVPLVMSAAAWGERPEDLPLLDPPKAYALAAARAELEALGALAPDGTLTEGGRGLYALPIDPPLARLLVEAGRTGCLDAAVDLVAALAAGRPIFQAGPAPDDAHDDLRLAGCDVTALVRAVRVGRPETHRVSGHALEEARRVRKNLRRAHGLGDSTLRDGPFDRDALVRAAIAADPRVVHVARARGRDVAFSNGGTELELARESAVRHVRDVAAVVVFDTRAFGAGTDARILVTCASAIPLSWIARAGLGEDRLAAVRLESGRVMAKVERVFAKRVIATRDETPTGEVARAAVAELFTRGSLFRGSDALATTRERLARRSLAAQLARHGHKAGHASDGPVPSLAEWVAARLCALGVESGDDLALLSPRDLTAEDLPFEVRSALDKEFPRVVSVGDASYEADYDIDAHQVTLRIVKGSRRDPPPLGYLPRFPGLRICVEGPKGFSVLRERR